MLLSSGRTATAPSQHSSVQVLFLFRVCGKINSVCFERLRHMIEKKLAMFICGVAALCVSSKWAAVVGQLHFTLFRVGLWVFYSQLKEAVSVAQYKRCCSLSAVCSRLSKTVCCATLLLSVQFGGVRVRWGAFMMSLRLRRKAARGSGEVSVQTAALSAELFELT